MHIRPHRQTDRQTELNKLRAEVNGKTVPTLMANAGTKLWLGNQEAFKGEYYVYEPKT